MILETVWRTFSRENMFPLMRLLLPKLDDERGNFGLREKGLGVMFIDVLGLSKESRGGKAITHYKNPRFVQGGMAGDIVTVIESVAAPRLPARGSKKDLTIREVNALLDELYMAESKQNRSVFLKIVTTMCGREVFWLCRIILKDMKMGMSKDSMLKHFHPKALDIFNCSSSLKKVCECVLNPKMMEDELNRLTVFSPCVPMLCGTMHWSNIVASMRGSQFAVEPKFDGERLHIHKEGDSFKFFTRNSTDYTEKYRYGDAFGDVILDCLHCDSCIVDGEIVAWDPVKKQFKKFGSNRGGGATSTTEEQRGHLCYIAFDILFLDGASLLSKPLRERRRILRSIVTTKKKRFEVIEQKTSFTTCEDILNELDQQMCDGLEGVIIKNLDSEYQLGQRSECWLKLKPDHIDGMLDEMDLCILGGYYGEGSRTGGARAGQISHFLLGLRGRPLNTVDIKEVENNKMIGKDGNPIWTTFCKVGTGYNFDELRELRERLDVVPAKGRRLPPYILPDTKLEPDDAPDVWVRDPMASIVMQLRSYEVVECRWDKFRAKFTLRFPRCTMIRYDKPPEQAMTWSQMFQFVIDTRLNQGGRQNRAATDVSDVKVETELFVRKTTRRKRRYQEEEDEDEDEEEDYAGGGQPLQFCILSVDSDVDKGKLEKEIKRNGGEFSQNPLPDTTDYILAGPRTFRIKNIISLGSYDVIHHSWLTECLEEKRLVPLKLRHVIYATESTKKDLESRMDKFGDLYAADCSVESIREVMKTMPMIMRKKRKTKRKRRIEEEEEEEEEEQGMPSRLRDLLEDASEEDAVRSRFSVFHRCNIYVDAYATVGEEKTRIPHSRLASLESKILMNGGRIATNVSREVTHIVIDDLGCNDQHQFVQYREEGEENWVGGLSKSKKEALGLLKRLRSKGWVNCFMYASIR
eukprot:jgi/Bigna1/49125/estExt_Genewise1.C_400012